MSPSATDLSTLSRLLDEAMDLPVEQVPAWLDALPPQHGHLVPRLREMLAEHGSNDHAGFLVEGPKLTRHAARVRLGQSRDDTVDRHYSVT
jgi:hypothetical protein